MSIALLHVEDEDAAAFLFGAALEEANVKANVFRVRDGEQALNFLAQSGDYKNVPQPSVIILDLNLPKVTGFDILTMLKSNGALAGIPVVVLTSSSHPMDRSRCMALGAKQYYTKPSTYDDLIGIAQSVQDLLPVEQLETL